MLAPIVAMIGGGGSSPSIMARRNVQPGALRGLRGERPRVLPAVGPFADDDVGAHA